MDHLNTSRPMEVKRSLTPVELLLVPTLFGINPFRISSTWKGLKG